VLIVSKEGEKQFLPTQGGIKNPIPCNLHIFPRPLGERVGVRGVFSSSEHP